MLFNYVNNMFPYLRIDPALEMRNFECPELSRCWGGLDIQSSPARKLSDLFWITLPWADIKRELGGEITIFDTGCGNGNYALKLLRFSDNSIFQYTGIDVAENENWISLNQKYPFCRFHQFDGQDVLKYIPKGTNFIMTQSAIEHFKEDLLYFSQIKQYVASYKKSVIQIHLFPSRECLELYLWHGIRQYTPRLVSKVVDFFKGSSYFLLFKLGGQECNRLHYEFITRPVLILKGADWRFKRAEEYDKKLFCSIEKDMRTPTRSASFYALVIHSNYKKRLFGP